MTATNHALTGTLIGLAIGQPLIAIPVALISHFICDAIPHFRSSVKGDGFVKVNWFIPYLVSEVFLCALIVLILAIVQPVHWQLAIVCAFVAVAPDLVSYKRFKLARKGKPYTPGLYVRFATKIQWFERPSGAVVEIAWAAGCIILILPFLHAA